MRLLLEGSWGETSPSAQTTAPISGWLIYSPKCLRSSCRCQQQLGPATFASVTAPARPPILVETIGELQHHLARANQQRVGLVPTMGYLHRGHGSLIEQARARDDVVVVSIFVNPLQFGPGEDFEQYPRDLDHDLSVSGAAGADIVFVPDGAEMYPHPPQITVTTGQLGQVLCGASRPGHFDGVATVVAKLFALMGRCAAYFGEKDYQQLCVIRSLAADLSLPVEVVGCPTVREPDGLAMSSRNAYLSTAERAQAPVLNRALHKGAECVTAGETNPTVVRDLMARTIAGADLAQLDYTAAVPADNIVAEGPLQGEVRLLVAARFGRARLIDNIAANAGSPSPTPA